MIQRIQSIFLLLAAIAAFSLFAFPFADSNMALEGSLLADQVYGIQDHIGLLALFCIAGGLSFVSIFLFNNRKNQLLVARIALVANIIGLVLAVILFVNDKVIAAATTADVDDGMGLYLPILFTVFAVLAQHFIGKDEKLVRSMDRLR